MEIKKLTYSVWKAEGTGRGDGWYFMLDGTIDGYAIHEGGEEYYTSKKKAVERAKIAIANIRYSDGIGCIY